MHINNQDWARIHGAPLTRDDLRAMTPEEIDAAAEAGQLAHLFGHTEDEAPQ
ncbi:hypothetical protein ACUN3E_05240 [Streptomyces sp. Ju416(a)]|uniref:hypothetical protein n=1 Tax=Streptomyces sp. Ju416(a) TaxID=3446591 RepID=UPI00403D56E8